MDLSIWSKGLAVSKQSLHFSDHLLLKQLATVKVNTILKIIV